mmetsp:Transcript_36628/g.95922  ORF Transcript_36628/g.95922 Transcript_36628/m.95922 type:complete len:283 (+) Transcript_36628:196-1044(+)
MGRLVGTALVWFGVAAAPAWGTTINLNTSGCEAGWLHGTAASWYYTKLQHPPYCQHDFRMSGNEFSVGSMTAYHAVPAGSFIEKVQFSFRFACGYQGTTTTNEPPMIFFEFVSNIAQSAHEPGQVVFGMNINCSEFWYDSSQYAPAIPVSVSVGIPANDAMYFRVRSIGGKDHNLQVPVLQAAGADTAGQGGLVDIVITTGAMPLSIGTLIVIIFFAAIVAPYMFGGMLYKKFVSKAEGWDILPNREFWSDVFVLIGLGCVFTFKKAKRMTHTSAETGYENL